MTSGFKIIGISTRTTNKNNQSQQDLGKLWGQFFSKNIIAKGNMPNAVVNTWIGIWEKDKELNRKYTYDFEVYGLKSQNGEDSEVEIYIATK